MTDYNHLECKYVNSSNEKRSALFLPTVILNVYAENKLN